MGLMWKIVAFMFFLNISVGMLGTATDAGGDPVVDRQYQEFNKDRVKQINETFAGEVGGAPAEDSQDFGEKIFDFFNLGWLLKVKNFLKDTLFGVPTLMEKIGFFSSQQTTYINYIMTFIYSIGIFEFFSGKILNRQGTG